MVELSKGLKEELLKKHYGISGRHSAIQICSWNKLALEGGGVCYKQKFYGAHCHKCAQITPTAVWCQNNCIFCWRPQEFMKYSAISEEEVDSPDIIIKGVLKERERLLNGFGGNDKVDKSLLRDAMTPDHWAISLSGEPTLYPLLPELVIYLRDVMKARTIFIVSNAINTDMFLKLKDKNALPTQFYISLDAPNETIFKRVNRCSLKNGWKRVLDTLAVFRELNCRRVVRFTLIKGLNDDENFFEGYAELFSIANADFIEIKAYMWIGYSRKRLKKENMPLHEYVRDYSEKLVKFLPNYKIIDEDKRSRIVLLMNKNSRYNKNIF